MLIPVQTNFAQGQVDVVCSLTNGITRVYNGSNKLHNWAGGSLLTKDPDGTVRGEIDSDYACTVSWYRTDTRLRLDPDMEVQEVNGKLIIVPVHFGRAMIDTSFLAVDITDGRAPVLVYPPDLRWYLTCGLDLQPMEVTWECWVNPDDSQPITVTKSVKVGGNLENNGNLKRVRWVLEALYDRELSRYKFRGRCSSRQPVPLHWPGLVRVGDFVWKMSMGYAYKRFLPDDLENTAILQTALPRGFVALSPNLVVSRFQQCLLTPDSRYVLGPGQARRLLEADETELEALVRDIMASRPKIAY